MFASPILVASTYRPYLIFVITLLAKSVSNYLLVNDESRQMNDDHNCILQKSQRELVVLASLSVHGIEGAYDRFHHDKFVIHQCENEDGNIPYTTVLFFHELVTVE